MDDSRHGSNVSLLDSKQISCQNVIDGDVVQEILVFSSQINIIGLLTVMNII